MSYQAGPSTSPVALLDTLVAFMIAAGWVQDAYTADGTGKRAHLHKGAAFISLRSFINEDQDQLGGQSGIGGSGIAVLGHTAYANNANWYNQPGVPFMYLQNPNINVMDAVLPTPAGAIQNYWMFADAAGDSIILVALKQAGVYSYIFFGQIVKPQAYTGGAYFGGVRHNFNAFGSGHGVDQQSGPPAGPVGYLRADIDSFVNNWAFITNQGAAFGQFVTGKRMISSTYPTADNILFPGETIGYGEFRKRARSNTTQGLVLLPTHWLVERDFGGALTGGGWSYAGQIPDIFQCTSTGFVPGSQYTISTDQYIVFPEFAIRKYP